MMITINHKNIAEKLCQDLKEAVEFVFQTPSLEASSEVAMYGMMSDLPFRGIIKNEILKFFMQLYKPGSALIEMDNSQSKAPPKIVLKLMGWYSKALAWARSVTRT